MKTMPRCSSHAAFYWRDAIRSQTHDGLTSPRYVFTRSVLADQGVLPMAVAEQCNTHLVCYHMWRNSPIDILGNALIHSLVKKKRGIWYLPVEVHPQAKMCFLSCSFSWCVCAVSNCTNLFFAHLLAESVNVPFWFVTSQRVWRLGPGQIFSIQAASVMWNHFFLRGRWNKCHFMHLIAFKNFYVCLKGTQCSNL